MSNQTDFDRIARGTRTRKAVVRAITYALRMNGEQDMVRALRYLYENCPEDHERIRDYIQGNQKYIQSRMYGYVRRNLEVFY